MEPGSRQRAMEFKEPARELMGTLKHVPIALRETEITEMYH